MAAHVRYNSWYISLPFLAKQQLEMTKFCVVWWTWTTTANFLNFYFKFVVVYHIQFLDNFCSDNQTTCKWLKSTSRFIGKLKIFFWSTLSSGSPSWFRKLPINLAWARTYHAILEYLCGEWPTISSPFNSLMANLSNWLSNCLCVFLKHRSV